MSGNGTENRFGTLHQNNRVLRFAVVLLLISTAVLAYSNAFRSQIVTIVPSNNLWKSTYTSTTADEGGLGGWGLSIAELIGNVTPTSADFVTNNLASIMTPDAYKAGVEKITEAVDKIKANQLVLKFDPTTLKVDEPKKVVYVNGWLITTDAHGTSSREEHTYVIYFTVLNYQPRVIGIDSYDGKPKFGQ
jgi:conjugal transfer pilus assembly protein TraE